MKLRIYGALLLLATLALSQSTFAMQSGTDKTALNNLIKDYTFFDAAKLQTLLTAALAGRANYNPKQWVDVVSQIYNAANVDMDKITTPAQIGQLVTAATDLNTRVTARGTRGINPALITTADQALAFVDSYGKFLDAGGSPKAYADAYKRAKTLLDAGANQCRAIALDLAKANTVILRSNELINNVILKANKKDTLDAKILTLQKDLKAFSLLKIGAYPTDGTLVALATPYVDFFTAVRDAMIAAETTNYFYGSGKFKTYGDITDKTNPKGTIKVFTPTGLVPTSVDVALIDAVKNVFSNATAGAGVNEIKLLADALLNTKPFIYDGFALGDILGITAATARIMTQLDKVLTEATIANRTISSDLAKDSLEVLLNQVKTLKANPDKAAHDQLQKDKADLEQKHTDLQTNKAALDTQHATLQKDKTALEAQHTAAAAKQAQDLLDLKTRLDLEKKVIEDALANLKANPVISPAQTTKIAQLEKDFAKLEGDIQKLTTDLKNETDEKNAAITKADAETAAKKALQEAIDKLKQENATLAATIAALQAGKPVDATENATLQGEIARLTTEIAQLKTTHAGTTQTGTAYLQAAKAELQKVQDAADQLKAEIEQLKTATTKHADTTQANAAELEAAKKQTTDLIETNRKLQEALTQVQKELEANKLKIPLPKPNLGAGGGATPVVVPVKPNPTAGGGATPVVVPAVNTTADSTKGGASDPVVVPVKANPMADSTIDGAEDGLASFKDLGLGDVKSSSLPENSKLADLNTTNKLYAYGEKINKLFENAGIPLEPAFNPRGPLYFTRDKNKTNDIKLRTAIRNYMKTFIDRTSAKNDVNSKVFPALPRQ